MAKAKKIIVSKKSPPLKKWNQLVKTGRGLGSGKGKPKAIETPEKLWSLFEEYRDWSLATPLKVHQYGKVYQDRARAITFIGFEAYLDEKDVIHHLGNYEQNVDGRYEDYKPIIKKIKKACSNNIITGALGGVYNANLASRLEGLTDKQDIKVDDNRKVVADMFPFKKDKDE